MKSLLENQSENTPGTAATEESGAVQVVGPCTIFVGATEWDDAVVTIWGRGRGATTFIVMGENAARTADGPVTIDVEGPWDVKAVMTNAGASTSGVNAYANQ